MHLKDKKLLKLLGIIGLITIFFYGCTPKESTVKKSTSSATKLPSLKVGTMPAPDSLPLYVAEEEGFFKDEGVNVTLQNFKSPKDRDAAIAANQLDGANTDMNAFAAYRQGDLDWKITSLSTGYFAIVTNNPDIKTVKDLAGHSVTFLKTQAPQYYLDQELAKSKIDPSSITIQEVPQIPVRLELVKNKQVDATVVPDPFITLGKKSGLHVVSQSDPTKFQDTIFAFSQATLTDKKGSVEAFYRAYNRAVAEINKHSAKDYEDILINNLGYTKDIMKDVKLPHYSKATLPNKTQLKNVIDWSKTNGTFSKAYKYDDFVSKIIK